MRITKPEPVYAYVGAVSVVGIGALVALLVLDAHIVRQRFDLEVLVFAVVVIITELRPLQVSRGDEEVEVTVSTAFAFALLLSAGTATAAIVLVLATLLAEAIERKQWWKATFNVAQYTLAIIASGATLGALTDLRPLEPAVFSASIIPGILVAGMVFIVVNAGLTGTAVSLVQRLPILAFFREDIAFQAASAAVLMSAAPVVVVIAEHSFALLPLIAVPLYVGYRITAVSLEKEHQALHDGLTGLPNRTLFYECAQRATLNAEREGRTVALMVIDLDRFKEINDALGHTTGDELLRQVGVRLVEALDSRDTVARLGGDEFGVIFSDVGDSAGAEGVATRLNDLLEEPFEVEALRLEIGASIGIALCSDATTGVDTLLRRADVAMYVAKSNGIGRQVYLPEQDQHSIERLALVGELRRAIAERQLVVHFQPKIDLRSGRATGAEALVRWLHPVRGMLPPDEFISLAEQTGLIKPLTMVVLHEALRRCRTWHDAGHRITVAVNLSARALYGEGLPLDVAASLEACGLEARWLTLELTESVIMADQVRSAHVLSELDGMGVRLSIDDFGTGYSSLAYLKRLPVSEIKIDKSFISNLVDDESDAVIARSTVDLGRNLGMRVVAEGVETGAVLSRLEEMGCDVVQGFLLSRPVSSESLVAWLDDFRGSGRGPAADAVAAVRGQQPLDITTTDAAPASQTSAERTFRR